MALLIVASLALFVDKFSFAACAVVSDKDIGKLHRARAKTRERMQTGARAAISLDFADCPRRLSHPRGNHLSVAFVSNGPRQCSANRSNSYGARLKHCFPP